MNIHTCHDIEERWYEYLSNLDDQREQERDAEDDLEHEHALMHAHVDDLSNQSATDEDWPFYADKPYIVVRPQVFTR